MAAECAPVVYGVRANEDNQLQRERSSMVFGREHRDHRLRLVRALGTKLWQDFETASISYSEVGGPSILAECCKVTLYRTRSTPFAVSACLWSCLKFNNWLKLNKKLVRGLEIYDRRIGFIGVPAESRPGVNHGPVQFFFHQIKQQTQRSTSDFSMDGIRSKGGPIIGAFSIHEALKAGASVTRAARQRSP
jgi:hypothetical protein